MHTRAFVSGREWEGWELRDVRGSRLAGLPLLLPAGPGPCRLLLPLAGPPTRAVARLEPGY